MLISRKTKTHYLLFALLALICAAFFIGLSNGPIAIKLGNIFNLSANERQILWQIRWPRVLAAFIVGASLASAGASFQGILQNPLADPYILGVSAGAALGAVLFFLFGLSTSIFFLPLSAFMGAMIATLTVFFIIRLVKQYSIIHFILVGIMVNAFFSSANFLILVFADEKLAHIFSWLMGDITLVPFSILIWIFLLAGIITGALTMLSQKINIVSLGDATATSVGINIYRLRIAVFFLASILTGLAVACSGIVGFIGLVVPHFLRLIINDDFRILIPFSFLLGGSFLVLTDTIARTIIPGMEIPVGVLTSFIGAPFFIFLFIKTLSKET
ncbi:FecCD family ABC transporter permease [Candidatus Margulisiibacteriota bacterium]